MGVSLYTSRVVLDTLGFQDYGVYSVVGGVVGLFSFFHMAMSSATQRFLSFEIGANNFDQLKKTFNAVVNIHFGIAILVLILAETVGLWFVMNKLNVPDNRMDAIHWVYQSSVLSLMLGIIQVPYNSLIIARERMNVYAYISILEVFFKLLILYILVMFDVDKLKLYAVLIFMASLVVRIIYQIYCKVQFAESRYKLYFDKKLYKELLSFTGWNLFGNVAAIARGQGSNILLNLFFGAVLNAAYGITLTVSGAVRTFVGNFQMAMNPQIIKTYAAGDKEQCLKLIFQSSKFSFFLMFLLASPIIYNVDFILKLWLKNPPKYTSLFVVLSLVNVLIDTISGPLIIGAQASGKIKWYQITIGSLILLCLPISYVFLQFYKLPEIIFIVIIILNVISLFLRIFFLRKLISLPIIPFIKNVLLKIIFTSLTLVFLIYLFNKLFTIQNPIYELVIKSAYITIINIATITVIGLNKNERHFILSFIKKRIN
ncbi:MATE family efflux transporter [Thalassobellus suaedae]|uniref:MATE family efflux transporter n=1 Tax=Thalassobellus suaedae TaxID=3074124 RepID=A0ABY9Y1X4_9FLAO|nr:MATE family efflux transporter [Flavobacteriaceae bacterium HL-DH10]